MQLEREDGSEINDSVWAVITREEAALLLTAVQFSFEEDPVDPGWHHHLDGDGSQLTIGITATS